MPNEYKNLEVPVAHLRWRLDPSTLPLETTAELEPLEEIIGQDRGVNAFRFGMNMNKPGYNVFVTGRAGTGRLEMVKRMLADFSSREKAPEDLCYVNNFKVTETPLLLRFKAGDGERFRLEMQRFVEAMKNDVPQFFEGEEYITRRKEMTEAYEKRIREFFKGLDKRVKEMGFSLVQVPQGEQQRPVLMPMVDNEPKPMMLLEEMTEKNRFPKDEYEELKKKYEQLKLEIDKIFLEVRDLQKELQEKGRKFEQMMVRNLATERLSPIIDMFDSPKVRAYSESIVDDMTEHMQIFSPIQGAGMQQAPAIMASGDPFQPYQVNLLVDNSGKKSPPVIIETLPTYRNLFGSIERIVDRSGVWRTDFSKIKAGSFLNANGGYLVLNLLDLLPEPGVWQALKRALKTEEMEIQTFDPFYWFTSTGLKPEPIPVDIKVVVLSDPHLYQLLRFYDEDMARIFKVRADFDQVMEKTDESILQLLRVVQTRTSEQGLLPLDRSGMAAFLEQAVRDTGRKEKLTIRLPALVDFLNEANYYAEQEKSAVINEKHVDQAIAARKKSCDLIEEKIQEMMDRGSLLIDIDGEVVGQVNGLTVIDLGDYMFGRPARITATTAMGREGIINIEREAEMAGNIHNKGVLILNGYLRRMYAQDKPLSVSASIAFEQSYAGVEGDSASSTELYALLSSLADVPIRQTIAVTGSVNQKGEIQAIGGVNEKIEGFYDVCVKTGLVDKQGVIIPASNVLDLMLRKNVVRAVEEGKFHVWAITTIDEGLEILTGRPAGQRRATGTYPDGSINALVNEKLLGFARGLQAFGESVQKKKNKKKGPAATKKKPA